MIHRLICALHITAAFMICITPVLSHAGHEFFNIEILEVDSDDTEKDCEDESEGKEFITIVPLSSGLPDQMIPSYQVNEIKRSPTEEHLELFTPPPER